MTGQPPHARSPDERPGLTRVRLALTVGDCRVEAALKVPAAAVPLWAMLPPLQALTDVVVQVASQMTQQAGKTISCRDRCGVCCQQLVPLSQAEAYYFHHVIRNLPPDRRRRAQDRFAATRRRMAETGLMDKMNSWDSLDRDQRYGLAADCFNLHLPCAFLEDDSCSIYPDRPLVCREFLVTSPPEHCRGPLPGRVARVPLKGRLSPALYRLSGRGDGKFAWVPLVLASEWVEAQPDPPPLRTGPQWLEEILTLARQEANGKELVR